MPSPIKLGQRTTDLRNITQVIENLSKISAKKSSPYNTSVFFLRVKGLEFDKELKAKIKEWDREKNIKKKDIDLEEIFRNIKAVVQPENEKLLNIFSVNSEEDINKLDFAILSALLKGSRFYLSIIIYYYIKPKKINNKL